MTETARRLQEDNKTAARTRPVGVTPASVTSATAPVWDDAANERERQRARVRRVATRGLLYVTATFFALFICFSLANVNMVKF